LPQVNQRPGNDPALIKSDLPIGHAHAFPSGGDLGYWPSYSTISADARAVYLDWLASGKQAGADIRFVLLYFYGLERRALFDARHSALARIEIPAIQAEIERLLALYPEERLFQQFAKDFLVAAHSSIGPIDPRAIAPPMLNTGWEFPLSLRVALGS